MGGGHLQLLSAEDWLEQQVVRFQNERILAKPEPAHSVPVFGDARGLIAQIEAARHDSLCDQLMSAAVAYAHHGAIWQLAAMDERAALDQARTVARNTFIDACNILARAMAKSGENAAWREQLENERKRIGDFACAFRLELALRVR